MSTFYFDLLTVDVCQNRLNFQWLHLNAQKQMFNLVYYKTFLFLILKNGEQNVTQSKKASN